MTTEKRGMGRPANDPGLSKDWNGSALRAQRQLAGYTLEGLSAEIALRKVQAAKSTLHRWENNHNAPNPEQLAALCDVFACRPAVFSKAPQLRR